MRFHHIPVLLLTLAFAWPLPVQGASPEAGSLSDYLDRLNRDGMKIVYTTDLVTEDMRLGERPDTAVTLQELRSILAPFGLAAKPGPANSILIVPGETPSAHGALPEPEVPIPEILVTSSLHRLDYSNASTHTYLDQELVTRLPITADESVRLTNYLPGTASGGVSSQNHIRGGEANEVLFLLDGLRLYEPYHLKDFQAIATIVNANAVASMDFYTGAYPAHYGDRMSGVLSIDLRRPEKPLETELAVSFFNTSLLSMGEFGGNGKGSWLLTARRGNLDLIVDVVDPERGSPDYRDYLASVGWEFGPRADISANLLVSNDKLTLVDADRGERASAEYTNRVLWVKWLAEWSDRLKSESLLAVSDINDRRSGELNLPGIVTGVLDEERDFSAVELRQDWRWLASKNWMLRFGFDLKDLDGRYRFRSQQDIAPPFDSIFDNQLSTTRDFALAPAGAQYAVFSELRWRLAKHWTFDVGLRWDQQTYTTANDDKQYSPRASVLFQASGGTEIRLGGGLFHQAQEINELQLSDGIDEFFPAQRAEHVVLNVQHGFRNGIEASLSVYRKSFRTLRPRFENGVNALTLLPELQFDRVRIDPLGAEAVGAEFMLTQGSSAEDTFWWLGYSWSRIEDDTPTGRVRRSWDQTHDVKAGISRRWGAWNLSAVAQAHTGWPKTLLSGELVALPGGGTSLELDVSDRNAARHSVFHSLDIRLSRDFDLERSDLTVFLEITNLYDRDNPCCTEYSVLTDGSLASRESHWLPLVPSLGLVWRF